MTFNFNNSKKMALSKKDKSSVKSWDKKIAGLCDKINSSDKYFTTSSCSGRVVLIKDEVKKEKGLFLFRSHDKISFKELKRELDNICGGEEAESHPPNPKLKKARGLIMFKQEPCLVVVSCKDSESQWKLFSKARNNGWKKSGIYSLDKKRLVELMSCENISFPICKNGKVLVNDDFLKVVVEKVNGNLEKGWGKIRGLRGLIKP